MRTSSSKMTAGAVLALVLGAAPAARAESSYTVPIPVQEVSAELHLIGASEAGVAVQRVSPAVERTSVNPVFTGALGRELTARPQLDPGGVQPNQRDLLGVTGTTLTWYEHWYHVGAGGNLPRRTNILTGKQAEESEEFSEPDAFNGESWFSDAINYNVGDPGNPPPVRQYHTGPKGITTTDVLIPAVRGVEGVSLTADQNAVLWASKRRAASGNRFALDLVTLKARTVTRLLETDQEILDVELTPAAMIWSQVAPGGGYTINQRPRTGGATTTYTESDEHADVAHLAAGPAGIGYLITSPAAEPDPSSWPSTELVVVNGSTGRHVSLSYGGSGLAAVGDHFVTAAGGYSGTAGVYQITGDEVTRVATVPPAFVPASKLLLSAGNLRYSDASVNEYQPGMGVFERTVTPGRRATFSSQRELIRTSGPIAFSAARGVVGVPGKNYTWKILDRGQETGEIEAVGEPNISGPYTMIGGKVFRPDGELIYTQPVPAGTDRGGDDLFGPLVAYARTKADGSSQIWLDHAERPAANVLADVPAGCGGRRPSVSVWGELVAWAAGCGDQISVRHLRTGETRLVPITGGTLTGLSLSEGTLLWTTQEYTDAPDLESQVLDLTSPTSVPVRLPDTSSLVSVDDHQVARQVYTGGSSLDWAPQPELMPLPFSPKYSPRLISRNSPLGFTPDGDGHRDVWAPEFDLTKPMRSVTLKITDPAGTKTLASLAGTAADGSVRDLSWNGLTSKGQQLPPGEYRWVLTGRSVDGDGPLIAADGSSQVTGTVEIDRS